MGGGRYSPTREQGVHHFHRLMAGNSGSGGGGRQARGERREATGDRGLGERAAGPAMGTGEQGETQRGAGLAGGPVVSFGSE